MDWNPENPAPTDLRVLARFQVEQNRRRRELEIQVATEQEKLAIDTMREKSAQVRKAMAHPYAWATNYTETYNEQWLKQGRPSPYEPFPQRPYFTPLFEMLLSPEPVWWFEKSRTMMLSWALVAYFTWEAQRTPMCGVLFQAQKEDKVVQLIDYAKCLYRRQPGWLKEAFPLAKPLEQQGSTEMVYASGAYIAGIPGGADQIRSYHPWAYLNDESAFQPEAGDCYNEALAAGCAKVVFNSSAGPGWYADARHDSILGAQG